MGSQVYGGAELAAALHTMPLYGLDLRLWLEWPAGRGERRLLTENMQELADAGGVTVWVAAPGASAVVLDGCRDLASSSSDGGEPWTRYVPCGLTDRPAFASDADGRLVPRDGPVVMAAGGVAIVSRPEAVVEEALERYQTVWTRPGLTYLDLSVLGDGRLALRYADQTLLAIGSRELRRVLRGAGWADEDLCVVSEVSLDQAPVFNEHLRTLAGGLGVDIYSRMPESLLVIRDGHPRALAADGRPAEWHRTSAPGAPSDDARWRSEDGWLEPGEVATPPTDRPLSIHAAGARSLESLSSAGERRPAHISLSAADLRRPGVPWLARQLTVNAEPLRLCVETDCSADRASDEGIPSPNLFLVGHADVPPPMTEARRWLRVHAAPESAVLASTVEAYAPLRVRDQLTGERTYLLPAGWLDRVSVVADPVTTGAPPSPLVLRCTGADHGIDGLPNELVTWPHPEPTQAFALVPSEVDVPDVVVLHRRRPEPQPGHRLLELLVENGAAIDVAASAALVARLPLVRSRMMDLVVAGIEIIATRSTAERVRVTRRLEVRRGRWRPSG
jgi:hypothetical protein